MRVANVLPSVAQLVLAASLAYSVEAHGVRDAPGASNETEPERCASHRMPYNSQCTGCPPMYDGKLCASTTRYNDRVMGSCGCAEGRIGSQATELPGYHWSLTSYTAALNAKSLDPKDPLLAWCPSLCGQCYRLCSTGGSAQGRLQFPKTDECRVFKIINRCGDGYKQYPEWCSNELSWSECQDNPAACARENSTNMFGYSAHFDLQDADLQVTAGLGWDNIEVTFELVSCKLWEGPPESPCPACEA
mmetsp:Transcript_14987/g.38513  ORF Transcript_14987/g.38513 Transcript_14987/m.38513 type:complete len:247 (+) Transcript_14987:51-791(+)